MPATAPTLPAESFPLPARVEWFGHRRGIFRAPFAFISPTLGRIEIEENFDTDYASVPRGLWNLYPPDGPYSPAAWIHDWLYWYQPCTREEADKVILEAMTALGIGWITRHVIYRAVRLGGGGPWKRAARERLGLDDFFTAKRQAVQFHKIRK
jgi:hypothetical protein